MVSAREAIDELRIRDRYEPLVAPKDRVALCHVIAAFERLERSHDEMLGVLERVERSSRSNQWEKLSTHHQAMRDAIDNAKRVGGAS